jgi:hypothetical protein
MEASNINQKKMENILRVRDPSKLLYTIIGALVLALVCFVTNVFLFDGFDSTVVICSLIFNGLLLVMIYRLKVIWRGIELDVENRTMSFQGGGISANDFADYFKLSYLLQYFKRFEIDIDEISQIEASNSESKTFDKTLNTWITTKYIGISFVGSFGSASVEFNDAGKRDQIYNAIRQLNSMGTPYVKAN